VAVAGCGDPIATGSFRPPYVTLLGNLKLAGMAPTLEAPSVALIWQSRSNDDKVARLRTQTISGTGSFTVDVVELPPPESYQQLPPEVADGFGVDRALRWAAGTLVVYEDRDHDGQLTLVPPGQSSPDRILGAAADYDIFYLVQGRPADPTYLGFLPTATGFSLVHEPALRDPNPYDCDEVHAGYVYTELCHQFAVAGQAAQALPIDTRIVVPIADPAQPSDVAQLQSYACRSYWGGYHGFGDWELDPKQRCYGVLGVDCPFDTAAIPTDAAAKMHGCSDDNLAYAYTHCEPNAALCGTQICHFSHGALFVGEPVPAWWPCPQP
jgi:hypothetical protein